MNRKRKGKIRIGHDGLLGDTADLPINYKVFFWDAREAHNEAINSDFITEIILKMENGKKKKIPIDELFVEIKTPDASEGFIY